MSLAATEEAVNWFEEWFQSLLLHVVRRITAAHHLSVDLSREIDPRVAISTRIGIRLPFRGVCVEPIDCHPSERRRLRRCSELRRSNRRGEIP